MSQADLAAAAGIHRITYVRLELGQRSPQPRTIRRLAEALGVDPAALLSETEPGATNALGRDAIVVALP